MPPNIFEISGSIIYPRSNNFNDGSVAIDIHPSHQRPPGPPLTALTPPLKSGPQNPLYRLPQSLSSGGLKIHLNTYTPPQRSRDLNRHSTYSSIDEAHILYEVAKASIGDASAEYRLTSFAVAAEDDGPDGGAYGRGHVRFTPGWISGGVWTVEYFWKMPGQRRDSRVDLKFDEGGKENGVWKMTFPMEGVVAKELPQPAGEFGENGRALEIVEGPPGLDGWNEAAWRDFLVAVFITKVWRDCTKTEWFGASVRRGEAGKLSTW